MNKSYLIPKQEIWYIMEKLCPHCKEELDQHNYAEYTCLKCGIVYVIKEKYD